MRDLRRVGKKLRTVLLPMQAEADTLKELRDWDLWGPLLLCLVLSIITSASAPEGQTSLVFASVFVLVWVGAAVVTINAQLLGANLCGVRAKRAPARRCVLIARLARLAAARASPARRSFFQSVCVLGYCVCPLVIAALLGLLWRNAFWRTPLVIGAFLWSSRGAARGAQEMRSRQRALTPCAPLPPPPSRAQRPSSS
jgi:hypothetical protein